MDTKLKKAIIISVQRNQQRGGHDVIIRSNTHQNAVKIMIL